MKTMRRLYFYLVAFISMEVVLWGLIGLARSIFSSSVGGGANDLAQALARILVGVPIFGIHWWAAQRRASVDEEERASGVRAFFLYAVLLALFAPIVQSGWAVLNRIFLDSANIELSRALVGGRQSYSDNLISIVMNGILGIYFLNVLRGDWATVRETNSLRITRRIYRYLWLLYSLGLSVAGTQQVLRYLLTRLSSSGTSVSKDEWFLNGLALLLIGVPLWFWRWKTVQDSLDEPSERNSLLRLGVLYFLSLAGVITVLSAGGVAIKEILDFLFLENDFRDLLRGLRSPLAIGIPLGIIWAYYGGWLTRDLEAVPNAPRRAEIQRFYAYMLAFIGLVATFTGVATLLTFFIDLLRDNQYIYYNPLTDSLATLIVGLPLWLHYWRPMQAEALTKGPESESARRSLIRKIYLYVAIFVGVIGGMIAAVGLVSLVLEALLDSPEKYFLTGLLDNVEFIALFSILFIYHWTTLQADGKSQVDTADKEEVEFNVLCLAENDDPFALQLASLIEKECPEINLIVQPTPETEAIAHVLILPEDMAFTNDEKLRAWLSQFNGSKFIIPRETSEWLWVNDPELLAKSLRQLVKGESLSLKKKAPAWMIAIYILAGLMIFQIIFILLLIVVENFGL